MLIPSTCITLRTIKYSDSRTIVNVLSRTRGRLAVIVADGNTPAARRRRALMMPGAAFDCLIDMRDNRSLQSLRDVMPRRLVIGGDPMASAVIMFACDFLSALLREQQPDEFLFDFVDSALRHITSPGNHIANAPLAFLIGLQQFMGIAPDTSTYRDGYCFDFTGGIFRPTPPLNGKWLDAAESRALVTILRMNFQNMCRFRLSREERRTILDNLLDYYGVHFGNIHSLPSLQILRSLFD